MSQNKFVPVLEYSGTNLRKNVIDNSQTLSVGEAVIPAVNGTESVLQTGGGTTGALLGVVVSIEGKDGKVLEVNSTTVASDNVTVDQVKADYFPIAIPMEWAATLDAAAGTTTGSTAFGQFAVDATGLLVDESSYVAFTTVIAKQFFSYGIIPGTTTEITGVFTKKIGNTA